jgi:heptose I phosphotransferase
VTAATKGINPQTLYLRDDIAEIWGGADVLQQAFGLQGEIFRDVPGRRTLRVELDGSHYFVKLHYGVGWAEIVKNWLQFKRPVVGAANEFTACQGLAQAGIPAPLAAAYAASFGSIAARRSFILCDELSGYTSLEDLTDRWESQPPDKYLKRRMLYAVAAFARRFHEQGFIHRDFYICHLLAQDAAYAEGRITLAVLDLHRARRFDNIPRRWLKRDLAALLFSSMDLGFSRRDWLRFIRIYTGQPLRQVLREQGAFWQAVLDRAERVYDKGLRKKVVKGLYRS